MKYYKNSTQELDPKYQSLREFFEGWKNSDFEMNADRVDAIRRTRGIVPMESRVAAANLSQAKSFSLGTVEKGDWVQIKVSGEGLVRSGSKKYKVGPGEKYPKLSAEKLVDPSEAPFRVICKQNGKKIYESFTSTGDSFFAATQAGEIQCALNVTKTVTEAKSQVQLTAVMQRLRRQEAIDSIQQYLDNEKRYAEKLVERILNLKEKSVQVVRKLLAVQQSRIKDHRANFAPAPATKRR
jgi:hypothetical protein